MHKHRIHMILMKTQKCEIKIMKWIDWLNICGKAKTKIEVISGSFVCVFIIISHSMCVNELGLSWLDWLITNAKKTNSSAVKTNGKKQETRCIYVHLCAYTEKKQHRNENEFDTCHATSKWEYVFFAVCLCTAQTSYCRWCTHFPIWINTCKQQNWCTL